MVPPHKSLKRQAILMSKWGMNNVWSWDNCFNAMAMAKGFPELAEDQMLLMADYQDEFGAYPDAINDLDYHFNFHKPPIHAWAFALYARTKP